MTKRQRSQRPGGRRVLPGLDPHLPTTAARMLTRRGVEVRTGTTIEKAAGDGVLLSAVLTTIAS